MPVRRRSAPFKVLGFKGVLQVHAGKLATVLGKHSKLPAEVLDDLPRYLGDPMLIVPGQANDGRTLVVLSVPGKDGSPVFASVEASADGRNTVFTLFVADEGGAERAIRAVDTAIRRGEEVYSRNGFAGSASVAEASGAFSLNGPVAVMDTRKAAKQIATRADAVNKYRTFYQSFSDGPRGRILYQSSGSGRGYAASRDSLDIAERRIAKYAKAMGWKLLGTGSSRISMSTYQTWEHPAHVDEDGDPIPVKLRFSDHLLPGHHSQSDFDVLTRAVDHGSLTENGDWLAALDHLSRLSGEAVPDAARKEEAAVTKRLETKAYKAEKARIEGAVAAFTKRLEEARAAVASDQYEASRSSSGKTWYLKKIGGGILGNFSVPPDGAYSDEAVRAAVVTQAERGLAERQQELADLEVGQSTPNDARILYQGDGPVASVSGMEIAPARSTLKDLRAKAKGWFIANLRGTSVHSKALGRVVEFASPKKMLAFTADPQKLRAIPALREIIAKGELLSSREPYNKATDPSTKAYHRIGATVQIGGAVKIVEVTIREGANGHLYYDHFLPENAARNPEAPDYNTGLGETGSALEQVAASGDNFNLTIKSLSDGPRGRILFPASGYGTAKTTIELFQSRNLSTLLHELGHEWLEQLRADAALPDAPARLKADWQAVQDWFAAHGHPLTADGTIPTEAHEMWARGTERFLMEGKAPSSALRNLFETFRGWLVAIYKAVDNLRAPITPEIREVMARLIATDAEISQAAEELAEAGSLAFADRVRQDIAKIRNFHVACDFHSRLMKIA